MKYVLTNDAGRYVAAFTTKVGVTYMFTPKRELAEEFDGSLDWVGIEKRLQTKLRPVFIEYDDITVPF